MALKQIALALTTCLITANAATPALRLPVPNFNPKQHIALRHTPSEAASTQEATATHPASTATSQPPANDKTQPTSAPQYNTASIVRVHDCLLVATLHLDKWNIECMRTGSSDKESWDKSSWKITPTARTIVPAKLWPVCTWLNGFGYDQLVNTPDLGIDRSLGQTSRRHNVFMYEHGYDVSAGLTMITRLGKYCPAYGKNVHAPKKKDKSWIEYIDII